MSESMRYLTNRCPVHRHDWELISETKYRKVLKCRRCDQPLWHMVDPSHFEDELYPDIRDKPVNRYVLPVRHNPNE